MKLLRGDGVGEKRQTQGRGSHRRAEQRSAPQAIGIVIPQGEGGLYHAIARHGELDLRTPDPRTEIRPAGLVSPERRRLRMPIAWQHVRGDVDYYDILIPPLTGNCDILGRGELFIRAPGMRLRLPGFDAEEESLNTITEHCDTRLTKQPFCARMFSNM